jgi:hypothetical protein
MTNEEARELTRRWVKREITQTQFNYIIYQHGYTREEFLQFFKKAESRYTAIYCLKCFMWVFYLWTITGLYLYFVCGKMPVGFN